MSSVPNEILLEIFAYLPQDSKDRSLIQVAATSRRFCTLARLLLFAASAYNPYHDLDDMESISVSESAPQAAGEPPSQRLEFLTSTAIAPLIKTLRIWTNEDIMVIEDDPAIHPFLDTIFSGLPRFTALRKLTAKDLTFTRETLRALALAPPGLDLKMYNCGFRTNFLPDEVDSQPFWDASLDVTIFASRFSFQFVLELGSEASAAYSGHRHIPEWNFLRKEHLSAFTLTVVNADDIPSELPSLRELYISLDATLYPDLMTKTLKRLSLVHFPVLKVLGIAFITVTSGHNFRYGLPEDPSVREHGPFPMLEEFHGAPELISFFCKRLPTLWRIARWPLDSEPLGPQCTYRDRELSTEEFLAVVREAELPTSIAHVSMDLDIRDHRPEQPYLASLFRDHFLNLSEFNLRTWTCPQQADERVLSFFDVFTSKDVPATLRVLAVELWEWVGQTPRKLDCNSRRGDIWPEIVVDDLQVQCPHIRVISIVDPGFMVDWRKDENGVVAIDVAPTHDERQTNPWHASPCTPHSRRPDRFAGEHHLTRFGPLPLVHLCAAETSGCYACVATADYVQSSRDDMDVHDSASTVDVFPHSATRRPFPGTRRSLLILQHRPAPQSQSSHERLLHAAALPTKSSAVPQHAPGLPSSEAVATSIPPPANAKPSTHPPAGYSRSKAAAPSF
uniref:F-box domain-containing protein n=1 Tax=Mycena chlorophos TaxID=658473 RepID=A0ABQ0L4T1_MYCCL|nr:predicted protein [Mycena chlorophos]